MRIGARGGLFCAARRGGIFRQARAFLQRAEDRWRDALFIGFLRRSAAARGDVVGYDGSRKVRFHSR